MHNRHVASQYKKTDQLKVFQPEDANTVLLKCFDELIKSVKSFQENIVPDTMNFRKKSSYFSRALTLIYSLQSSIDFEKDLGVAKSLFQIYEYTRVVLIQEFKSCKVDKSVNALRALSEIRNSWAEVQETN